MLISSLFEIAQKWKQPDKYIYKFFKIHTMKQYSEKVESNIDTHNNMNES